MGTTLADRLSPDIIIERHEFKEDWRHARRSVITASEAASLCGRGYDSEYSLAQKKLGNEPELLNVEALEAGLRMEPTIAGWYEDKTGRPTEDLGPYTLVRNPAFPWLAATLDRLTEIEADVAPLEFKLPNAFTLKEWEYDIPVRFHIQNLVQMICTGTSRGSVAALVGGSHFRWMDTFYHERMAEAIIKTTKQFWDNLQAGILPDPDGHPATTAVLGFLHPDDNGQRVAIPSDADFEIERWFELDEEIKGLENERDGCKNRLKEMVGDNTWGFTPTHEVSWKTQGGRETGVVFARPKGMSDEAWLKMKTNLLDLPSHVLGHYKGTVSTSAVSRVLRKKVRKA